MTVIAPAGTGLRWAIADGWTVARRDFIHWSRQPGVVLVGLLFPVMVALLFAGLFGGAITLPGGGDYLDYLMPGMFAVAMLFGVETTTMAVCTDVAKGVTDRFRSMPMARSAVLVGRCVADLLHSAVGLATLMLAGLALGWRPDASAGAIIGAIGLLMLLRFAVLWVGIYLGLLIRDPAGIAAVQILVWPFTFLTTAFSPPGAMPAWLGAIAEANPMSATVGAVRDLLGGPGSGGTGWMAENAGLLAVVWPVLASAVFFWLAVNRYHRMSR